MSKWKYIFILFLTFTIVTSCKKDFLDVPIKNVVLRQAYVVDLKTTGDYLNGMYVSLATIISNTGLNYPEVIADNIKPKSGSSHLATFYGWTQRADDSRPGSGLLTGGINANGFWANGIRMAQGCSFVLESADKYRSENPQLADNLKGQAYTLRAMIHSIMVNIFAQSYFFTADASHPGIPYTTTSDWAQPATRLSVAKVYDGMITDLNAAIPLLPDVQNPPSGFSYSLITSTAAKAISARVCLYKGDWQTAKNLAAQLAKTVPLMTNAGGYPGKLFTNSETEAIFQLPPAFSGATASAGNYPLTFGAVWYSGSNLQLVATSDMSAILKENPQDLRNAWVKDTTIGVAIKKFPIGVIPGFSIPSASYFQTLIRSSEMYLIAAESYAQLNNKDSAVFYLDAIRKRAWSTALPTTATGPALLDSIYKERRKELCFEGLRMFDIQRWKQAVNRDPGDVPAAIKNLPYGSDKAIAPIPVSDVQMLGMPQNPGY
jgi:starch-binding outer membrane protein, SusD/RagB family